MEVTITLKDIKLEDLTQIFIASFKSCGKVEIVNNTFNQVDTHYKKITSKIDELEEEIQRLRENKDSDENEEETENTEEYKTKNFRVGNLYNRFCTRCQKYFDTEKAGAKICPDCVKPRGRQQYNPNKRKCEFCTDEFISNYPQQKFCGEKCRNAYKRNKPDKNNDSVSKIKDMIDNNNLE
jgi:hypothetical protein